MSKLSFLVADVKKARTAGSALSLDTLNAMALPCLNWCRRFLDDAPNDDAIAEAFRSHELADAARKAFPDSCHTPFGESLVAGFEEFRHLRATLRPVAGITVERVANELRGAGSLLVTDWAGSLFDGALTPETHGFIDDDGMPPWDTWLAIIRVPASQAPACLLSWVPSWLAGKIDFAIRVDAAECLSWLLVDENKLIFNGWGKSLQAERCE